MITTDLFKQCMKSVQIRENKDQKKSVFGHFSRSKFFKEILKRNLVLIFIVIEKQPETSKLLFQQ